MARLKDMMNFMVVLCVGFSCMLESESLPLGLTTAPPSGRDRPLCFSGLTAQRLVSTQI